MRANRLRSIFKVCAFPAAFMILVLGCSSSPSSRTHRVLQTVPIADTEAAQDRNRSAIKAMRRGDAEAAEELLLEALGADRDYGPAHNNLGTLYLEQGQLYLAAKSFERAAQLMPHHPEPRNNLGLVMEHARRFDESIEHYQTALQMHAENYEVLGNLVRARLHRGDPLAEVRPLLRELVLIERRPEWRRWAEAKLAESAD